MEWTLVVSVDSGWSMAYLCVFICAPLAYGGEYCHPISGHMMVPRGFFICGWLLASGISPQTER